MFLIGIIVAIVALDQWSKWMIKSSYELYHSEPVIQGFFHFTYVTNDGMAFGLSFPGGKQVLLFVTLALTGVIIWMLWKEKNSHNLIRYGLSFILAGAVGNMIDRLLYPALPSRAHLRQLSSNSNLYKVFPLPAIDTNRDLQLNKFHL